MASTRYYVAATTAHENSKLYSRKEYAVNEGRKRIAATPANESVVVMTDKDAPVWASVGSADIPRRKKNTTTATEQTPEVTTPEVQEAVQQTAEKTAKPAKKNGRRATKKRAKKAAARQLRQAQGETALDDYELLYEFPRLGAEIHRLKAGTTPAEGHTRYGLHCLTHAHTTWMKVLTEDRQLRREGTWCPSCVAEDGPSARAHRRAVAA